MLVTIKTNKATENYSHTGFGQIYQDTKTYCTGSKYQGYVNALDFCGEGTYTFADNSIYKGSFENGLFHGKGEITFPNGKTIQARFFEGELVPSTCYLWNRGKLINLENINVSLLRDRRFNIEFEKKLQPVGKEYKTWDEVPRKLPKNCYQLADGLYIADNNIIVIDGDKEGEIKATRLPSAKEEKWIKENCRFYKSRPVGYYPKDYTKWTTGRKSEMEEERKSIEREPEIQDPSSTTTLEETTSEIITVDETVKTHELDDILTRINKMIERPSDDVDNTPSTPLSFISDWDYFSDQRDKPVLQTEKEAKTVIHYLKVLHKNIKLNELGEWSPNPPIFEAETEEEVDSDVDYEPDT
ncbi:uncharacterized protein LOC109594549 isoform X2 [Aethina tumida]|nr:uncharacterized protein LOC109594549 isoform X2 [Aethina tumida]